MKTITIKIIQWSDIKQWWLDRFGVRTIKRNAREMCDFIESKFNHELEGIIAKHYGDDFWAKDGQAYTNCVCNLKERLEEICEEAKKLIHV